MRDTVRPLPLRPWHAPFDHEEWAFEVKHDGFRALAHVNRQGVTLVSRIGHTYRDLRLLDLGRALHAELAGRRCILDGEIVCLASDGRSLFDDLFYRRGVVYFAAFDALMVDGRDIRSRRLLERKRRLRDLVPENALRLATSTTWRRRGWRCSRRSCAHDLEGIVAKWMPAPYTVLARGTPWLKIKNRAYSQAAERHERFARRLTAPAG